MASVQLLSVDDPRLTPPRKHLWQDHAKCSEISPEFFFPKRGGSTLDAKLICQGCDVRLRCLQYAMDYESGPDVDAHYGIFGGLSERERRKLRKVMKNNPSLTLSEASDVVVETRKQKGNSKGSGSARLKAA